LAVLGLHVAQGRVFTASEINSTGPQPPAIAILSHELWQSALGARTIVGQTTNIDGRPHEIIGVMPPGADIMDSRTELWLPSSSMPAGSRTASHISYRWWAG
jgi:hypothetical protein